MLEHRAPAKGKAKPKPTTKGAAQPTKPTTQAQPAKPTTKAETQKSAPGPKATPKPTPKSTPAAVKKWPKLKVVRPTKAVDLCDFLVKCERQDDLEDDVIAARSFQFVAPPQITPAPTSTALPRNAPVIGKRDIRTFTPDFGKQAGFEFLNVRYPGPKVLYKKGRGKNAIQPPYHVMVFSTDNTDDFKVKDTGKEPTSAEFDNLVSEHIVEVSICNCKMNTTNKSQLQSVKLFQDYAVSKTAGLDKFFINFWNKDLDRLEITGRAHKPSYPKGPTERKTINQLVFDAFGSTNNKNALILCNDQINAYKARIWKMIDTTDATEYEKDVKASISGALPSSVYLSHIRTVRNVLH
jgi:hypothetical protein